MSYCPAGYSAKNESKPDTGLKDSQFEAPQENTESEGSKSFLEEFGDKEISFGDKRGTVAEAMERCPHLQQLGETALRGVVSAVIASQEQEPEKEPEKEEPAKPLLPESDKPKTHKQTDKTKKDARAKEAFVAAGAVYDRVEEQEVEPTPKEAGRVNEPVESSVDEYMLTASHDYAAEEPISRHENSNAQTEKPIQPTPEHQAGIPTQPPELVAEQQETPTSTDEVIDPAVDESLRVYDAAENEDMATSFTEELEGIDQETAATVGVNHELLETYENTTLSAEPVDGEAVNHSSEVTAYTTETYNRQEQITEDLESTDLEFDFSEDYDAEEFTPEVLEVFMELAELSAEVLDEEIEPIENSASFMTDSGKAEYSNEAPENTAFEDFIQSIAEEVAPKPEDIMSASHEDAPAEERLQQLALILSEHPETDSFKPAMDAIEAIQRQLYENLSAQEGEAKTVTITPETADQLLALLRNLGYQNPKEALMELINRRGLRFVMQMVNYLAQLRDAGNRQEFKTEPMLFKPAGHAVHHPLGAHLGQLAITLASQGLRPGKLIAK